MQRAGAERITTDIFDGSLRGVVFQGERHPDFGKTSRRGAHYPKKGTEWAKRFAAQVGYKNPESTICDAFNVPTCIDYRGNGGHGFRHIGAMLRACGFLYMGAEGPYAMWIPDVAAEVAASEAEGYTVAEPAKSFKLEVEGLRPIESEEWEILVLQHQLKEKKNATGVA